jgi:hypothetical protein
LISLNSNSTALPLWTWKVAIRPVACLSTLSAVTFPLMLKLNPAYQANSAPELEAELTTASPH